MWGNRLGWGISAVIVIVTMALLYGLAQMLGTVTPTTELVTDGPALEPIELPVPPKSIFLVEAQDCDAGELYWQAIQDYRANKDAYDLFLQRPRSGDATLPAVDLILKATACNRMRLFADRLDEVVMHGSEKPAIEALDALGRATINLGLLNKPDPETALEYYSAAFSLGSKLFEERIVYSEMMLGMNLMSQAAQAMARLADERGEFGRESELKDFDLRRLDYYKRRIEPVQRVISSADSRIIDRHAGDVAAIALQARERMWRVEATLTLGRQRYFVGRVGDQRGAERALKKLSQDPDPAVQLAARKALALTIKDYRLMQ